MRRGKFHGLCYLCGIPCARTYCNEHKWAAKHLGLPDRSEPFLPVTEPESTGTTLLVTTLQRNMELITRQETKLNAWRRSSARPKGAVGAGQT